MDNNYHKSYSGVDINIEEMTQGCIIGRADLAPFACVVATIEDATALIASLQRLVKSLESKHGN